MPAADSDALVVAYRAALVQLGSSAATVNRRLACLRSLARVARVLGVINWQLEIQNLRATAYRDTSGPDRDTIRSMLSVAAGQTTVRAARDQALLHLMFDLAHRRGELCRIDLDDVDLPRRRIAIIGKGRTEKAYLSLPSTTAGVLARWLAARGALPGPLFLSFDPTRKGARNRRLTGAGVWSIVKRLGARAGANVRPHGLRHAAITAALDATNGDIRSVQRYSRHVSPATVLIYDDNRRDLAAAVAELISLSPADDTL